MLGADTIADLVEEVSPAVVNIVSTSYASRSQIIRLQRESGTQDPNRKIRRQFGVDAPEEAGRQVHTSGAGVVIRSDGYILTCRHVVQSAEDIKVILNNGRQYDAQVVGKDGFVDLAVIKVSAVGLPVVRFGDENKLRAGQWVFAIGNPYGYNSSVSAGLISGLHREARKYSLALGASTGQITFIQTDVPLNEGSSGGPLFNLQGEVVGINSFIRADDRAHVQNIGFATPASLVKKVAEELIKKGIANHPYLGVEMREAGERPQGAGIVPGVEITKVKTPSPANSAGMQTGDLIQEIDGMPVNSPAEVSSQMAAHSVGERILVKIRRDGADKNLSVRIENMPEDND